MARSSSATARHAEGRWAPVLTTPVVSGLVLVDFSQSTPTQRYWTSGNFPLRAGRVIHFPSDAQSWPSALARLIDRTTPMTPVQQDDGNAQVSYEAFQPSADDPEPGAFWGWAMIGGNSGLMCAPLPLMAYDALTRATAAACARVGLEGLSVLSFRSTHYDTQGPTERRDLAQSLGCRPDGNVSVRHSAGAGRCGLWYRERQAG
ncbi:hypothetical protein G6F68_014099 [Rhizopus microsporus]|nr:hypothetical protein G6F68_014099 [Rhizopus microsporus]